MKFLNFIALVKTNNLRIAYRFASEDVDKVEKQRQTFIEKMNVGQIDIPYNFHFISTDSPEQAALVQYDPYFSQFKFVKLDQFYDLALKEFKLNIMDVAAYLKRRFKLEAFPLQKCLYYIYADYFVKNSKAPFEANFITDKYGPVNKLVYVINGNTPEKLENNFDFEQKVYGLNDYDTFIDFVDDEVNKYCDIFNSKKMKNNPTHRPDTPWSITKDKKGLNVKISDALILSNHIYEKVE